MQLIGPAVRLTACLVALAALTSSTRGALAQSPAPSCANHPAGCGHSGTVVNDISRATERINVYDPTCQAIKEALDDLLSQQSNSGLDRIHRYPPTLDGGAAAMWSYHWSWYGAPPGSKFIDVSDTAYASYLTDDDRNKFAIHEGYHLAGNWGPESEMDAAFYADWCYDSYGAFRRWPKWAKPGRTDMKELDMNRKIAIATLAALVQLGLSQFEAMGQTPSDAHVLIAAAAHARGQVTKGISIHPLFSGPKTDPDPDALPASTLDLMMQVMEADTTSERAQESGKWTVQFSRPMYENENIARVFVSLSVRDPNHGGGNVLIYQYTVRRENNLWAVTDTQPAAHGSGIPIRRR